MHNTPFTDMTDSEAETHEMGYQAFEVAHRVLELLTATIGAGRIDPERVADILNRSCATITELADWLVRTENLSFRQGHEIAADVSRAVVARAGNLKRDGYEVFAAAFREHTGRARARARTNSSVRSRRRISSPSATASAAPLLPQWMRRSPIIARRWPVFESRAAAHAAREKAAQAELERRMAEIAEMSNGAD